MLLADVRSLRIEQGTEVDRIALQFDFIVNQGIEVEFDATVAKLGDFSWDLYGNYATNDNEILELAQDAQGNDINLDGGYNASRVGRSIGAWFLRTWGGVDSSDGRPYYIVGGDETPEQGYSDEITYSQFSALQSWQGERIPTYSGGIGTLSLIHI